MADLEDIRGVGAATASTLADHGLTSVKKLAKAGIDAITAVPGFGVIRATAVRDEARAAVPDKAGKAKEPSKGSKAGASKAKAKKGGGAKKKKGAKAKKPAAGKAKGKKTKS